eukprot:Gregarina_sp_Pseudo_9__1958@NODE_2350_length_1028_cov_5734_869565_g2164_i0_p1_GENE_NODE_2350_length_1028_cov_5734_869565_g2164_i0NODE_2350_length_1028_cov_5734_869565_g2164_i0_p1_ORF_typecomplete_len342_score32_68Integrin_beta/PF00362_18/2_6e18_NODE_2350_length_1028_cov_5734_869565_g2164_i01561028
MKPISGKRAKLSRSGECAFPFDIVFVQDCTTTFVDHWPNLKDIQLPLAMQSIETSHPGSRFAPLMFKDKPVHPLGIPPSAEIGGYHDFCLVWGQRLTQEPSHVLGMYDDLVPYGGGDFYESHFVSLLAASQLPFGWSSDSAKLIVVITDAPPHFDQDGFNPGLAPHSDRYGEPDEETQCKTQYYPSPDQVKSSVRSAGAYVAVLAHESGIGNNLTTRSWEWFIRHLEETDNFLQFINGDSSNFWEALSGVVAEVERLECARHSTLPPATPSPTQRPPHCSPCPTGVCAMY